MTIVIQVATMPDREFPVAELWYGPAMIAEVNQESGDDLMLELYGPAISLKLNLLDFAAALLRAKEALGEESAFEKPDLGDDSGK